MSVRKFCSLIGKFPHYVIIKERRVIEMDKES